MSKLILWNVISLDGFFDGERNWELDWHHTVLGEEFHAFALEQLRSAGMLLFGRVTYEGMVAYWQTATDPIAPFMNSLPKVVFSRTLERADWAHTTLIKSDAVAAVLDLKSRIEKDLYVFGSGKLCAALLQAGLFDELRLALAPVVLGRGTGLFGRDLDRAPMRLLESRPLSNGCVILRYAPVAG
jgi:dihydrofolate reductase